MMAATMTTANLYDVGYWRSPGRARVTHLSVRLNPAVRDLLEETGLFDVPADDVPLCSRAGENLVEISTSVGRECGDCQAELQYIDNKIDDRREWAHRVADLVTRIWGEAP